MLMQMLKYSLALGMMIWLSKVAVFADEAACTDRPWDCKDHVFLCEKATYISNGKVAWDYRPNGASFADGARQQGLTCQVGKVAQTQNKSKEQSCDDNALLCLDYQLCRKATDTLSGNTIWLDNWYPTYVKEAKRRNLTCGVRDCTDDPNECSNEELCAQATDTLSGKTVWLDNWYPTYVKEAKRRKLTCGVVGKVNQTQDKSKLKTCGGNILGCSGEALCEVATRKISGKYRWQDKLYPKHVAEAKRRKLTCGVVNKVAETQNKSSTVVTKKVTSAEMLRQDFNAQTVLIRKQIQYALRQLGYYDSAIDGIWGKRTRTAIMRFSERNNLTTYPPRRIYFEALELVDVPNSFPDRPSRSTQKSSDECVSILSLIGIPLCNKNTDWNSTPVRRSSGVESCISDIDCEYPQKCIGSAGRRTCGTIVDQYGNRSTDPLSKPMTCISSSDCPASFRCDSTLRVCVR